MGTDNGQARPGSDTIPVTIDGEACELRATFGAARTISNRYGGTAPAINKVLNLDLECISDVLALGLGYSQSQRPPKDFPEKVYRTGLTDSTGGLAEIAVMFLHTLANGGKVPDPDQLEQDSGEGKDPTQSESASQTG